MVASETFYNGQFNNSQHTNGERTTLGKIFAIYSEETATFGEFSMTELERERELDFMNWIS